jgi:superfamily II DNA/RNA helicase
LKELFNLLQFVDPDTYNTADLELKFASIGSAGKSAESEAKKEDVKDEDKNDSDQESDQETKKESAAPQVKELHDLLRPRILRRLKEETLKDMLPNKVSLVVPVGMSKLQKEMYRELMTRSYTILQGAGAKKAQMNLLMQLQKCCNHPYLFENTEPQNLSPEEVQRLLIDASGKLVLLDKMLTKLKAGGHRVLVFSHMTSLLDILEDYVRHNKWGYCRLDGQTSPTERQLLIDRFNTKPDEYFVFLLSTLAGGLGINLATADTVILFDSDWNPHNDLQALSRCHRIGQKSKVMIYRFVTRNSVEEGIVSVAQKKLGLETIVVRSMGRGVDPKTLKAILGHGVAKLFSENPNESDIVYDDAAVEKLLDRNQEEVSPDSAHAPEGASEALKQYLGAFTVAKVWNDDAEVRIEEELETDGVDWQTIIKERYSRWERRKEQDLGRGKRRTTRNSAPAPKKGAISVSDGSSDEDADYAAVADDGAEDDDYEDNEEEDETKPKINRQGSETARQNPNHAMEQLRSQLPDGAKAAAHAALTQRSASKHFSGVAGIANLSHEVSQAQNKAAKIATVSHAAFQNAAAPPPQMASNSVHQTYQHQIARLQQFQAAMAAAHFQAIPGMYNPGNAIGFANGPSAERTKFVNQVEGFVDMQFRPSPEAYIRPTPPGAPLPQRLPAASSTATAPATLAAPNVPPGAVVVPDHVMLWLKSQSADPSVWQALLKSRPDIMRQIKPQVPQAPVAVITIDDDDDEPAPTPAKAPAVEKAAEPPAAVKPPPVAPVKSVVPIQSPPVNQPPVVTKPFVPPASLRRS